MTDRAIFEQREHERCSACVCWIDRVYADGHWIEHRDGVHQIGTCRRDPAHVQKTPDDWCFHFTAGADR